MSCCLGNTIARALALVSLGTAAAFVHWGIDPPTLELEPPSAAGAGQTDATSRHQDTPLPETGGSEKGATPTPEDTNTTGETGSDLEAQAGEVSAAQTPFNPNTLGTEISTAEAYQLWLTAEVAFIDARPQYQYIEGHIPFAYLVPVDTIDKGRLGDMMDMGGVDPSQRVVVYCEGGSCDSSKLVALSLQDIGFTTIHIDVDGFPAWQAAGYEVETGPDAVLGDVP